MKQISLPSLAILFLVLLSTNTLIICPSSASARLLLPKTHLDQTKPVETTQPLHFLPEDDFSSLMGLEDCVDREDDCVKRRMVAEAHLDYIYTQDNKHKP